MAPEKGNPAKKVAVAVGEEDDEDNVPIAFSRSKLAKNREAPRKREPEEDDDDRPIVFRSKPGNKKPGTPNGRAPARVTKEQEEEEEDGDWKPPKKEVVGKKKEDGKGSAAPVKVKKEEASGPEVSEDEEEDEGDEKDAKKKKKKKMIKKKVVENKKVAKKVSKVAPVENRKKREKKVYDLPGQKHDPPEERDPLRIFYETLYQQLPNSEMAQYWMMEYGLLPSEIAEKIFAMKLKKNPQSKLSSPVKAVSAKKTTASVKKVKQVSAGKTASKTTAKRKFCSTSSDEEDDDDFMLLKKKPKKQKVSR